MSKKINIEENFKKLDQIVADLEKPEISLEDSFDLYKTGVELLKECNESIDKVEKEIIVLNSNGEENEF
ncbi:MAG TPA: exodeoxyribonuclease VII small subunit [Clostridiales bacterium]|nr:exodeoxyribonuclease VII small subunit [Clostridiales bacterium]